MIDIATQILDDLAARSNLRELRDMQSRGKYISVGGVDYVNMSSNDYLGLTECVDLQSQFLAQYTQGDRFVMSNPSSRLMTGNSDDYTALEQSVARLYEGKTALVLSSGYMVNSGVLPALTAKGDLILADKFVHASVIDGLRLCEAEWQRFNHNDMAHLRKLLERHRNHYRNVWVVTESLFSMDGDTAPLAELVELKREFGLHLYLDEAHAFGVCGTAGAGLAAANGLDKQIDVIVATFGKALASCGAFVALDAVLRKLLVNRMRTLIFSTALPPLNLLWSRFLVERLGDFARRREHLAALVRIVAPLGDSTAATHIIPVMTYENSAALHLAERLREGGFWVTPVRYPTVPQSKARVRVSLSSAVSMDDARKFVELCKQIG